MTAVGAGSVGEVALSSFETTVLLTMDVLRKVEHVQYRGPGAW
jgi:hypothetical protein